jgi:hypothetical protein
LKNPFQRFSRQADDVRAGTLHPLDNPIAAFLQGICARLVEHVYHPEVPSDRLVGQDLQGHAGSLVKNFRFAIRSD